MEAGLATHLAGTVAPADGGAGAARGRESRLAWHGLGSRCLASAAQSS
jgi:hypothetical protein